MQNRTETHPFHSCLSLSPPSLPPLPPVLSLSRKKSEDCMLKPGSLAQDINYVHVS